MSSSGAMPCCTCVIYTHTHTHQGKCDSLSQGNCDTTLICGCFANLHIANVFLQYCNIVFLVKWNFVGEGQNQLPLEVGDTVYIQEACDGE